MALYVNIDAQYTWLGILWVEHKQDADNINFSSSNCQITHAGVTQAPTAVWLVHPPLSLK